MNKAILLNCRRHEAGGDMTSTLKGSAREDCAQLGLVSQMSCVGKCWRMCRNGERLDSHVLHQSAVVIVTV